MSEDQMLWMEQCDAAERIKEDYGIKKAIGYLIGEKFIGFIRYKKLNQEFTDENLKQFALRIRAIFSEEEIKDYFENVRRVGPLGHVMSDEAYETFRSADPDGDDPAVGAEIILIMEEARDLLLLA